MAQNRRQAIIWTNDGLGYWLIYASLGLNELNGHHTAGGKPDFTGRYTGCLNCLEKSKISQSVRRSHLTMSLLSMTKTDHACTHMILTHGIPHIIYCRVCESNSITRLRTYWSVTVYLLTVTSVWLWGQICERCMYSQWTVSSYEQLNCFKPIIIYDVHTYNIALQLYTWVIYIYIYMITLYTFNH